MEKIIRISHKDLNEYIKMYSEKQSEKNPDKSDEVLRDVNSSNHFILKDEEVEFLIALLGEVEPDNVIEKEIISNIKNSLETKNNEKR